MSRIPPHCGAKSTVAKHIFTVFLLCKIIHLVTSERIVAFTSPTAAQYAANPIASYFEWTLSCYASGRVAALSKLIEMRYLVTRRTTRPTQKGKDERPIKTVESKPATYLPECV